MTRSAHNVDKQRTKEAQFLDKRSYWTNDGHEFLFGNDVTNRRMEVYEDAQGHCQGCCLLTSWNAGHMHHKQGGLVGRCTCKHNLEWLCIKCHLGHHVQPQFGRKEIHEGT